MKICRRCILFCLALLMLISVTACGSDVPDNTVFSSQDLPGKKIGLILGTLAYTKSDELTEMGAFTSSYTSAESAAADLKEGNIDCIILDKEPAEKITNEVPNLTILDKPYSFENFAVCVAKENIDLAQALDGAIDQLRDQGVLDGLYDKYINGGDYTYSSPENTDLSAGTLRLAADPAMAPYEFTQGTEIQGLEIDVVRAACDILGVDIEIIPTDREEIINSIYTGRAEMGVGCLEESDDGQDRVEFSQSYTQATQVIIVRK